MTPPAMPPLTMALPMIAPINYFMAYNSAYRNTNNATCNNGTFNICWVLLPCSPHNYHTAVDFGAGCQILQWTWQILSFVGIRFGNCCFHATLDSASSSLSEPLWGGVGISIVDLAVLWCDSRQFLCGNEYVKSMLVSCCDWRLSGLKSVGFGESVQEWV